MQDTQQLKQALRDARALLLKARADGGKGLDGVWQYLRCELDGAK